VDNYPKMQRPAPALSN